MKTIAVIGGIMFLLGICSGSLPWATFLVVVGGSMCAFGCSYCEEVQ